MYWLKTDTRFCLVSGCRQKLLLQIYMKQTLMEHENTFPNEKSVLNYSILKNCWRHTQHSLNEHNHFRLDLVLREVSSMSSSSFNFNNISTCKFNSNRVVVFCCLHSISFILERERNSISVNSIESNSKQEEASPSSSEIHLQKLTVNYISNVILRIIANEMLLLLLFWCLSTS